MNKTKIVSHCFAPQEVQQISDYVDGTTQLYDKAAKGGLPSDILFCGVLYMAEDIYCLSEGETNIYIPETTVSCSKIVEPRCPMEIDASLERITKARKEKSDAVLAYINTSVTVKAAADAVYNGTQALDVMDNFLAARSNVSKDMKVLLIGDKNVNWWIVQTSKKSHPLAEVVSYTPDILCPPHNEISIDAIEQLVDRLLSSVPASEIGFAFHSELNSEVLSYALKNNYYIGGTTGIFNELEQNQSKKKWIIPTIDDYVYQLIQKTQKDIVSPEITCPHMKYTTRDKVEYAKRVLEENGPAAEIVISSDNPDGYAINILNESLAVKDGDSMTIPAVRISISNDMMLSAKKSLMHLIN